RISFPPVEGWEPVVEVPVADEVVVTASPAPPTRAVATYRPQRIQRISGDRQVVTLPANINGWLRVAPRSLGPAGTTMRLTHGESLGPDGDVDMAALEVLDFMTQAPLGHGQVDEVTSAGPDGPAFE